MPRIEEYGVPEVQANEPALDISSRPIEEAGQAGRAVQRFADDFKQIGRAYYRQNVQDEQEDAQVTGAMNRAKSREKLDAQAREGRIDVSKTMEDYSQMVDDQSDKFQTREGKRAFDKQAAINRAMLFRSATTQKAHLDGENAKAAVQKTLDLDSSHLLAEPNSFPELYHAGMTAIDDQVNSGSIPAALAPKLKEAYGKELAKSAVHGWAQLNPQAAKDMLMGTKNNGKGAWDEFFDGDTKNQMLGEIHRAEVAKDVEIERHDRLEKKAQEKRADAFRISSMDDLYHNKLSTETVIAKVKDKTLSPAEGDMMIAKIRLNAIESVKTDLRLFGDLTQKIHLPVNDPNRIYSLGQLDEYAAKGQLDQRHYNILATAMKNTQDGKNNVANRGELLKAMRSALVSADKLTGFGDPVGEQNYAAAFQSLQDRETEMSKEGKNPNVLYDAKSPDSFYNQIDLYKKSSKDIMNANVARMRVQTGAEAVGSGQKATPSVPRLPNESWQQWQKRKTESDRQPQGVETPSPAPTPTPADDTPPQHKTLMQQQDERRAVSKKKAAAEADAEAKRLEEIAAKRDARGIRTSPQWPPQEF